MAKRHRRSNREAKKPKSKTPKTKTAAVLPLLPAAKAKTL